MKIPLWLIGLILLGAVLYIADKRFSRIESHLNQPNSEAPTSPDLSAEQKANAFVTTMSQEHQNRPSATHMKAPSVKTKGPASSVKKPVEYSQVPRANSDGIEDDYADATEKSAPVVRLKKNEPKITWTSSSTKKVAETRSEKRRETEAGVAEMPKNSTFYTTLYIDGKKIDPTSRLSKLFIAAYFDKRLNEEERRILAGTYAWTMRTSSEQAEEILFSKGKLKGCLQSVEADGTGSLRFRSGTKKIDSATEQQLLKVAKRYF